MAIRLDTADTAALASCILASLPATKANLKLVKSPIVDGEAGKGVDPKEIVWRQKAEDPRNVCVERDGELSIAQVGPEPTDYRDWLTKARRKDLGCGGRGFVLVDLGGDPAITHNLFTIESVPPRYAHLFRVTHLRVERMTDAQERAHWDRFEPWADVAQRAA